MQRCPICGHPSDKNASRCKQCGRAFGDGAAGSITPDPVVTPTPPPAVPGYVDPAPAPAPPPDVDRYSAPEPDRDPFNAPPAAPTPLIPGPGAVQMMPGQQPWMQPRMPTTSTNAIIALVLAILGWLFCPIIMAIAALVLASSAKREIRDSQGMVTGGGMAVAAQVISWIQIGLLGLFIVAMIIAAIVAPASGS